MRFAVIVMVLLIGVLVFYAGQDRGQKQGLSEAYGTCDELREGERRRSKAEVEALERQLEFYKRSDEMHYAFRLCIGQVSTEGTWMGKQVPVTTIDLGGTGVLVRSARDAHEFCSTEAFGCPVGQPCERGWRNSWETTEP